MVGEEDIVVADDLTALEGLISAQYRSLLTKKARVISQPNNLPGHSLAGTTRDLGVGIFDSHSTKKSERSRTVLLKYHNDDISMWGSGQP